MGKRGPKPKWRKFVWSPELAYVIGLFATDGCLYNDGRHLSFVSKDLEQLENFKKSLGMDTKITQKVSGYTGKTCTHLQWSDVAMYEFFLSVGLTPKKSLTIGELRIPKKFFFDFFRGAMDGDGSFYSYYDPRWKSSFMFYLTLSSGSKKFISWVRKELNDLLDVNGHVSLQKSKNVYQLKYAKTEASKIIEKMYYKPTVVCLGRKREKIEKALKTDSLVSLARVAEQ